MGRTKTLLLLSLLASGSVAQEFVSRSWDEAYALAESTLLQLDQSEKVGIVSGIGFPNGLCVGNNYPVKRDNINIPSLCFQDGPAGVRIFKNTTGLPAAINAASTFSRRLMNARGEILGKESRGKGINVMLAPAMDIMRNPKAGRGWESFGPDPYLQGEGAYETITGIQSAGVMACAKHFALNNQELFRRTSSSNADDRTIHEIYVYPYLRAIEANVATTMCSYNYINGTAACENENLLGDEGILRKSGFKGFVMSDWFATYANASVHANAGMDVDMPGGRTGDGDGTYGPYLTAALEAGTVSAETLDKMALRVLASFYLVGQDSNFPDFSVSLNNSVRSDEHTAIVKEIAAASSVLLKNNRKVNRKGKTSRGLPLSLDTLSSIAVLGPDADHQGEDCRNVNGCPKGTFSIGWGSGANNLDYTVPPIEAINAYVGSAAKITAALTNDTEVASVAAAGKDVALVFVNAQAGEGNHPSDREDLHLWYNGDNLIKATAAACKNTIVVIHAPGPVALEWSNHPNITAIVYAGLPGEQTGPGIVDVLFGLYSPSGRLPFSIDEDEASYGTEILYTNDTEIPSIDYTEGLFIDYRYMASKGIKPHYEFGFGLSYTTFKYSNLSVRKQGKSKIKVTFTITNTGRVDGTEIPQLYLGYPKNAGEPEKVLRGFEEVPLKAGKRSKVELTINEREMSVWDTVSQSWVRPKGKFQVYVGASIADIRLRGSF